MTKRNQLADEVAEKFTQKTGKRYCAHCNRWRPSTEFKQRRNGRHARCASCVAKRKVPEVIR